MFESSCRAWLLLKVKENISRVYIAASVLNINILILILDPMTGSTQGPF